MKIAVVIFCYKRLDHLKKVIDSIQSNSNHLNFTYYVYSDASRSIDDASEVVKVRNYLSNLKNNLEFNLILRKQNFGLANNIINGVTEVLLNHEACIILEDDLVVSKNFLEILSNLLYKYKNDERIWHINGFNYQIDSDDFKYYFSNFAYSWGWATWRKNWNKFINEPSFFVRNWSIEKKYRFDLDAQGIYWPQLIGNYKGTIKTWAVLWQATIFHFNGLVLTPSKNLVQSIGLDGSGENCLNNSNFNNFIPFEYSEEINIISLEESLKLSKLERKSQIKIIRPISIKNIINRFKILLEFYYYKNH